MSTVIPLKVGFFGEQGTGKTTSAALLAAAISKQFHSGAPVWVTDPELGWQFPKRRIFSAERVELVQRTVPTFKAMLSDMREAERAGACVWAVELSKIWMELLHSVQSRCGDRWGTELVAMWTDYVNLFLNSKMHCFALGRVGDITEDVMNERGEIKRHKIAEGMKAGGQRNNFGYEPHLVLRMGLEQRPRVKKGKTFEEEGRVIHRVHVLKDRTWTLTSKVIRWFAMNEYKLGGYAAVWESLRPHFEEMQATYGQPVLDTSDSSETMIDNSGRADYYASQNEREALLEEWDATMDLIAAGQTGEAKKIRAIVGEVFTGERSRKRFEEKSIPQIQSAVLQLMSFEKRIARDRPNSEEEWKTLANLCHTEIAEPGKKKSLLEIMLEKSVAQVSEGKLVANAH
jgi:hypothetical protein